MLMQSTMIYILRNIFLFGCIAAAASQKRADNTAVVHLGTSRGASEHLASGFIYGIPDTPGQIPSE